MARVWSIWAGMSSVAGAGVVTDVLEAPVRTDPSSLHLGLEPLRVLLQRFNRLSERQLLRPESGESGAKAPIADTSHQHAGTLMSPSLAAVMRPPRGAVGIGKSVGIGGLRARDLNQRVSAAAQS